MELSRTQSMVSTANESVEGLASSSELASFEPRAKAIADTQADMVIANGALEREDKQMQHRFFSISCLKNPSNRMLCGILTLHAFLLFILAAAVIVAIRWNDIISVSHGDVLVNNRDGTPLRVQQLVQSAQANLLAQPQLASAVRVVSVVVTLPRSHAESEAAAREASGGIVEKNQEDVIHRMYNVEGVEIREGANTTVLWLSMGHRLTITPDRVMLHDRRANSLIHSWDVLEEKALDITLIGTGGAQSSITAQFLGQNSVEGDATTTHDRKLQYIPPPVVTPVLPLVNFYPYTYPYPSYYVNRYIYPNAYMRPYNYYMGKKGHRHGLW